MSKVSKSKKTTTTDQPDKDVKKKVTNPNSSTDLSLIVGLGASAGGLKALETFFENMPKGNKMAFIIVQHMDPSHKSMLSEILSKHTEMDVAEAEDGAPVKADCVYTIPPNKDMALFNGKLQLTDPINSRGLRKPIDYFFRSLAIDQKERAVGIILSGTGTEGTVGLKTLKAAGGLTIVQEPNDATYDGMPRSAIAANVMDYILPVDKIPAELIKYDKQRHKKPLMEKPEDKLPANLLDKIFMILRTQTGNDFSQYKKSTINRRIEKRMAVNQIGRLIDYVKFLQKEPNEAQALFQSITIGVTSFFRDKEAFEVLKKKVLPAILANKNKGDNIRIWVPGCSTGEEAYSIAIMVKETLDELEDKRKVNIFATDLDNRAIEAARTGTFPEGINVDVSPERLKKFFIHNNHNYTIKKNIRNMIIFATQNLTQDPPFSKLDMISCRNLLIYLDANLQKKVFPLFHYSLATNGILFLGSSETIGQYSNLFSTLDRKWKFFTKKGMVTPTLKIDYHSPSITSIDRAEINSPPIKEEIPKRIKLRDIIEKDLLQHYAPASVVIDSKNNALYFFGNTGAFLQPGEGEASLNILEMAKDGLKLELSTTIRTARKENKEVIASDIDIQTDGLQRKINLKVKPVIHSDSENGLLMVLFEEVPVEKGKKKRSLSKKVVSSARMLELEQELAATKEHLQITIEELETSNEELKSANEELQSSNEELQSTNEELETSKEELQSLNEEMVTMNSELQNKIESLASASDDLSNLMASTQIGIVFLDIDLKVKKFTPSVTDVIPLMDTDIGRPIGHFSSVLLDEHLKSDVEKVLNTLIPFEREVQTNDKIWYNLRITPYRTTENVIEGVVMTFIDISKQKRGEESFHKVSTHLNLIMEALPAVPYIAVSSGNYSPIFVGESAKAVTGYEPSAFTTDKNFWLEQVHPDDRAKVREKLGKSSTEKLNDHEFRFKCEDGSYRKFINFIRLRNLPEENKSVLVGVWQDVTALRLSEAEFKDAFESMKVELEQLQKRITK